MQYVPSLLSITGLSQSSTPLPSEALSFFPRVLSLSCFIPPSDYPPLLYTFLPLPMFLLLMFHRWEKPYDNCLSMLDLFHLALSPPVPSMVQQMLRNHSLIAEQYSIVYMDHNFLIQSSVEGHLGSCHDLDIVHKATIPPTVNKGSLFSTSMLAFVIRCLFATVIDI